MTAIQTLTAILRKWVKWFYTICAILIICLAVVVQAGRSFSHLLGQYPQQISHYLSQQFNAQVSIGSLSAEWVGLKPMVHVNQLRIVSQSEQPILALAHAEMRLDLLDSLLHARLVWSTLKLNKLDVEFLQTSDGFWQIPGVPRDTSKPDEASAQLDPLIDMLLLSQHIEVDQSHFSFQFVSGTKTLLESPSVRMENAGDFHRLSLRVDVDKHPKTLQLTVEAKGDPRNKKQFTSRAFLQLDQFPTHEPIAAVTALLLHGSNAEVQSEGKLNAKLWFKSHKAREGFDVVGQLSVDRLKLPVIGHELTLNSYSSEIVGFWKYSGQWRLALQNMKARLHQDQNQADNHVENVNLVASAESLDAPLALHLQRLDLQALQHGLSAAGIWGESRLRDILLQLDPQGELRNLNVSIPLNNPRAWQLRANLAQVAVNAWHGVPALRKVDGFLQAGQDGGHVDLDSHEGFSMHFSPTYAAAMEFDQAKGQVAWWLQPTQNHIYVNSGALTLSKGNERVKGYMWLALPWQHGTGDIDLYLDIGATQLSASAYQKYTPSIVPPHLLSWLDASIGTQNTGVATAAGFVFRGTLNTPDHAARSYQLALNVQDAQLKFHPEWPRLEAINGHLLLDDETLSASLNSATLFASTVTHAEINLHPNPEDKGELLQVNGTIAGSAGDGLRVLRESMLRQYIGANMDSWRLDGAMKTRVDVAIPLVQGAQGAAQAVDIELLAPQFVMANLNVNARDLNGRIRYNQSAGLSSENLHAQLFDEPVDIFLTTKNLANKSQTRVDIKGDVDAGALARWSHRPEVLFLKGKIPYLAQVQLNHHTKALTPSKDATTGATIEAQEPFAVVTVKSGLAGVAVNLPAPYGKPANAERDLAFVMSLYDQSSLVDISYNNAVQALFALEPQTNTLRNAAVGLNSSAHLNLKPQFYVSGTLPNVDLALWQKVLQHYLAFEQQLAPRDLKPFAMAAVSTDLTAILSAGAEAQPQQSSPSLLFSQSPLASPNTGSGSGAGVSDGLVAGLPFYANVLLEHYQVGSVPLDALAVQAWRLPTAWKLAFTNPVVTGELYAPNDAAKPLDINLARLHLSPAEVALAEPNATPTPTMSTPALANKPALSVDPRSLPYANLTIAELFQGGENYGSWSLHIRPNDQGVLVENIHGKVRGVDVEGGSDPAAGATLNWSLKDATAYTQFEGSLSMVDISAALKAWQTPDMLESKAARFGVKLGWVGDPQDFQLKNLVGSMDIALESGRFKRNPSASSDGFLRLMATLNFDSLARRMRLDFSDLYQSGLAYDQINGKAIFEPGLMTFSEPLVLKTPSSRLQLAGKFDLDNERIDARLIATLPITGNFTFFTALVTGLPAAAGVYLVSKLFKKQLDQATSISYKIDGAWSDPTMKFDRLFESEESLRESVSKKAAQKKTKRVKTLKAPKT
jgi:uncharacterized protein (TIGR02099 family)